MQQAQDRGEIFHQQITQVHHDHSKYKKSLTEAYQNIDNYGQDLSILEEELVQEIILHVLCDLCPSLCDGLRVALLRLGSCAQVNLK